MLSYFISSLTVKLIGVLIPKLVWYIGTPLFHQNSVKMAHLLLILNYCYHGFSFSWPSSFDNIFLLTIHNKHITNKIVFYNCLSSMHPHKSSLFQQILRIFWRLGVRQTDVINVYFLKSVSKYRESKRESIPRQIPNLYRYLMTLVSQLMVLYEMKENSFSK